MPYLPISPLNQTEFPQAWMKDLATAVRMIAERYRRHFSLLPYYAIKVEPTAITCVGTTDEDRDVLTGGAGATCFDPLYDEPAVGDASGNWVQPHACAGLPATKTASEQFDGPFGMHMRVQRGHPELELKHHGFDRIRDLVVYVPLSSFDKHGISVRAGDYLVWDGDPYTVMDLDRTGYWHNSNLRLYMLLNCAKRRHGS